METPKTRTRVVLDLKALTICPETNHKHHNSCIMTSTLMSPPPTSFSHIGDYIGMESCVDLEDKEDVNLTTTDIDEASKGSRKCKRDGRWTTKKREFPQPISLLARAENLPSHMPSVLKRYYTSDGRLILREEKVRHHEYFKAHRSNGHLTLQLVRLDHDDDDCTISPSADLEQCNSEEEEQVPEADLKTADSGEKIDRSDNVVDEETVEKYDAIELSKENNSENESMGICGNGGANKCLNCSNVIMTSSCFLGLPVPAIKPVHI